MQGSSKTHTDREYERQLVLLRESIVGMAGLVEEMIAHSVEALISGDRELARATIEDDHRVNRAEVETDELCLLILAKRQPLASDLRFITLALKMVTDLERIGDLAVNICERAVDLADASHGTVWEETPLMSAVVRGMVQDAIAAFVERDVDKAQAVIDRDNEADDYYVKIFSDVLAVMRDDPSRAQWGIHVQSVAKWLERMADHATNIAEQVIFMVKGKDIRHMGKLDA